MKTENKALLTWYAFVVLVAILFTAVLMIPTASASPIIIDHAPEIWNWNNSALISDGKTDPINPDLFPYKILENSTYYTVIRGDETLYLIKEGMSYDFQPLSIGVVYNISTAISDIKISGNYKKIYIPETTKSKQFKWDNTPPNVVDSNNTPITDYVYQVENGKKYVYINLDAPKLKEKNIIKFSSYEVNASSTLNVDGGQYILSKNISCTSTCLTISASNISLNLNGYQLNFSNTSVGNGITVNTGLKNITISNGYIMQANQSLNGARGILFTNTSNSYISSITSIVNGTGQAFYIFTSSNNNTLIGNNGTSDSGQTFLISTSSNNTLIGNNGTSDSGYAFYISTSSNNNTLIGNNGTSDSGQTFLISTSSNNTLIGNNGTSNSGQAFRISTSSNNTLIGNNGTSNSGYAFRILNSNNSILSNNTGTSSTEGALLIENSYYNSIMLNTFYSLSLPTEDIALKTNSNRTNTFYTNWNSSRKIKFYNVGTEFNQSQNNLTWVNTNFSAVTQLNRTVLSWTQSNITFIENVTVSAMANYSITGLLPNTLYMKLNNSNNTQNLTSDATGTLIDNTVNYTANISQTLSYLMSNGSFDIISTYENRSNLSYNVIFNVSNITNGLTYWNISWSLTDAGNTYYLRYNNGSYVGINKTATVNNETLWFNSSTLLPEGIYFISETESSLPQTAWNISGYILDSLGKGLSGATIAFGSNSTTSNATGGYNFTNISNGTYLLNVSLTGYISNTTSITMNGADLSENITLLVSTPLSTSTWNKKAGVNLWLSSVGLLITAAIIGIVAIIILMIKGFREGVVNLEVLLLATIILAALVIVFIIIPLIGSMADQAFG